MESNKEEDTEVNEDSCLDIASLEKWEKFSVVFLSIGAIFLVGASAICPALMLYAGVEYRSCEAEPYYTNLLIAGGSTWYIVLIILGVNCCINGTVNIKKIRNQSTVGIIIYVLLLASSTTCLILWVWNIAEIFGPAQDAMKGRSSSRGIYDEELMKIEDCKFWIYDLSFWITLIPFILVGYFVFGAVSLACLGMPQD